MDFLCAFHPTSAITRPDTNANEMEPMIQLMGTIEAGKIISAWVVFSFSVRFLSRLDFYPIVNSIPARGWWR